MVCSGWHSYPTAHTHAHAHARTVRFALLLFSLFRCRFRGYVSQSKIEFAVDTREQDELKQVVLGWEAADPGRAEKAQALREDLSEQVDRSTAHAVVTRPSELSLRLLDEDLIAQV